MGGVLNRITTMEVVVADTRNGSARKVGFGITALALSAGAAVLMPATPAHAAGWLGQCTTAYNSNRSVGGWCDGNGPDHGYQAWAACTDGRTYYGPARWAGDRRGSWTGCPTGSYINSWNLMRW